MRILTVFFSLTGNTKKIAHAVSSAAGGDLLEIKLKKGLPSGFLRYIFAGKQLMQKRLPEIVPLSIDPNGYDLIFLGTPVWGSTFVPPVRAFLANAGLKNKKIALFCVHGGDNPGNAFQDIKKELVANQIVGSIDFKMDAMPPDIVERNLHQAADWAKDIAQK